MFDNTPQGRKARSPEPEAPLSDAEDARIALRCNRKELQLVDSFVASGEFESRSELMRASLHAFLRSRAQSATTTPSVDAEGYVEVPVRLRPDEYATLEAYAHHVANGRSVRDLLAELVRRGQLEGKMHAMVEQARETIRAAAKTRSEAGALSDSARDLERKGVVGR